MKAQVYLTSARPCDVLPSPAEQAAMEVFENTLVFCVKHWANGSTTVKLAVNIEESFGTLLVQYFAHALATRIGGPVTLSHADDHDGSKTLVHLPEPHGQQPFGQLQPDFSMVTATSDKNAVQLIAPTVSTKKAPRPMNCWIMFRDYMHKRLKAQHPDLSVQQICKHIQLFPDFALSN